MWKLWQLCVKCVPQQMRQIIVYWRDTAAYQMSQQKQHPSSKILCVLSIYSLHNSSTPMSQVLLSQVSYIHMPVCAQLSDRTAVSSNNFKGPSGITAKTCNINNWKLVSHFWLNLLLDLYYSGIHRGLTWLVVYWCSLQVQCSHYTHKPHL